MECGQRAERQPQSDRVHGRRRKGQPLVDPEHLDHQDRCRPGPTRPSPCPPSTRWATGRLDRAAARPGPERAPISATTPSTAITPSRTTAPIPAGPGPTEGASGVNWIHYPVTAGGRPAGTNEYLCTTYYEYAPGCPAPRGVRRRLRPGRPRPRTQACHGAAPELPGARHAAPHRLRVDHPDQQLQSARLRVRRHAPAARMAPSPPTSSRRAARSSSGG